MTGPSQKLPARSPVAVPSSALQAVAVAAIPSFPANEPMRSMAARAWAVDLLLCHCSTEALSLTWLTRASGEIADFILTGEMAQEDEDDDPDGSKLYEMIGRRMRKTEEADANAIMEVASVHLERVARNASESQGPEHPRANTPAGSVRDEIPASSSTRAADGLEIPADGYEAAKAGHSLRDNPFDNEMCTDEARALAWADGWWRHEFPASAAKPCVDPAVPAGCLDPLSNQGEAQSTTPTGGGDDEGDLAAEHQTEIHSCAAGAVAASPEKSPSVVDGEACDPDAAAAPEQVQEAPPRASVTCSDVTPLPTKRKTPSRAPARAGTGHQSPPAYASSKRHDAARVAGKEGAADEQAQIAEFLARRGALKIEPGGFEDLVLRTMKECGHEVTKKRRGCSPHIDWFVDGKKVGDWSAIVSRANKLRRAKGLDPLSSVDAA